MHLHHDAHGGKEPAIVGIAAHPTGLQVENAFDQTLEFIPIKSSVAMGSTARESYAGHSRLP
jgi:hypothetical protein